MSSGGPDGVGRRRVLASMGSAVVVGAAGCVGGDGPADDSQGADGTPTAGAGGGATDDETPAEADLLPRPTLGEADADVTVAVYKDFACPHCATFTEEVEPRLVSEYVDPGVVSLAHYDLPLPVSEPASWEAPNAARAVQANADDESFFAYADRLFANQSDLGPDTYAELAEAVAGETVRSAATERRYQATIDADRSSAIDRDVTGTPTVFVDGEQLDDWSWDPVRSAIEDARSE